MSDPATAARTGRIAATILLVFAAAYGLGGATIEYAFASDPIGPRGFPLLLACTLAALAGWYMLRPGEAEPWPDRTGARALGTFAVLFVACVLGMDWLGFVPAMTILMAGVAWLFGASPAMAAASGLGQALLWWGLFGPLLGGSLPKGPLGF